MYIYVKEPVLAEDNMGVDSNAVIHFLWSNLGAGVWCSICFVSILWPTFSVEELKPQTKKHNFHDQKLPFSAFFPGLIFFEYYIILYFILLYMMIYYCILLYFLFYIIILYYLIIYLYEIKLYYILLLYFYYVILYYIIICLSCFIILYYY